MKLRSQKLRVAAVQLLSAGLLGFVLLGASAAVADSSQKPRIERFDVKSGGRDAGAARTIVMAPQPLVRSVVTDFAHYESFIKRFKSAKVVGRVGNKTDVYLQVPIVKGTMKIWAIVRFDPPKTEGENDIITGTMVKGNVKRLDAVWRIKKLDAQRTELTLELLIVPDMPVPASLVRSELRGAAAKAVSGTRDEAERRVTGS